MRLLVSVRSAAEVDAAVAGGADIIDAKEPARGSLGAVSSQVFLEIVERVPCGTPVSAALGDVADPDEVSATVRRFPRVSDVQALYLKLGFAGITDPRHIEALLESARAAAAERGPAPGIIAVAYGDSRLAQSALPELVCQAAVAAGAAGLLLDTWGKGAGHLLDWIGPERLRELVNQGRKEGLLMAVAGGLRQNQLNAVSSSRPDVIGFRGAACEGGRLGVVSRHKVARLREAVDLTSDFVQAGALAPAPPVGETPEPPANLCR